MKIGILHMGFFYNGGGERTVLCQAHGLKKLGHEVTVYAPTVSVDCFPELQKGIDVIELNKWAPSDLPLRSAIGMMTSSINIPYKELKKNDVLIAHAQPSNWIAYAVRRRYDIPYITYLHQVNRFFKPRSVDTESAYRTNSNIAFLSILHKGNFGIKKIDEFSVKNSNLVLTNSRWIKSQIESYYGVTPWICYPGVDIEKFSYQNSIDRQRYILSTNRQYPQKRIDYVIKLMKYICQYYDDVRCIITGEFTNHTPELLALRERLGLKREVLFTGNVSNHNLVKLYKNAYSYAYTSPEEDFGLGPLESSACGTPSIVWDYAGPKETVVNGITGYRIKPYDVESMAKHHIMLLENEDLRNVMGKNASIYVCNKFTWEKHCEKLHSYIQQIIGKVKRTIC